MSTLIWNILRDFIVASRSTFFQNVAFCYPYLTLGLVDILPCRMVPSRSPLFYRHDTKVNIQFKHVSYMASKYW